MVTEDTSCNSHKDVMGSLQELTAGRVDKDAVFFCGGGAARG